MSGDMIKTAHAGSVECMHTEGNPSFHYWQVTEMITYNAEGKKGKRCFIYLLIAHQQRKESSSKLNDPKRKNKRLSMENLHEKQRCR